ncbi:[NiFe]-hydrogenase assembly chaperone HybE [Oryzomicrobium sp.]|uniref:[NiFe]-hydrogenase assembly chaperone HybE n=1 Tax=Oryzomicrobium sp. TaxID=1911578 RepID=UPI002FE085E6
MSRNPRFPSFPRQSAAQGDAAHAGAAVRDALAPAQASGAEAAEAAEARGNDLARAFARIAATAMAGLPINHPALTVEAIGFRPWQGLAVGVLVTPWAINLMLLPLAAGEAAAAAAGFAPLGPDRTRVWAFPAGDFAAMGGEAPETGPYHTVSLLSPVEGLATQADARCFALATLAALFTPGGIAAPEELPAASPASGAGPGSATSSNPATGADLGDGVSETGAASQSAQGMVGEQALARGFAPSAKTAAATGNGGGPVFTGSADAVAAVQPASAASASALAAAPADAARRGFFRRLTGTAGGRP